MARTGFWHATRRNAIGRDHQSQALSHGLSSSIGESAPPTILNNTAEALLLLKIFEESCQGWFWSTDQDGRLTYLSDSVSALISGENGTPIGSVFAELFVQADNDPSGRRTLPFILIKQSKFERLTLRGAISSGEHLWSVSGCPQYDAAGQFTGYRGSGVDITEQRRSSDYASQLAMYDSLTGLPNRLRMSEVLEANLLAADQARRTCAVMLIDLDRFKQVNDTLGHPAGDALLKQVAERLLRIVGDREKVFRLGGDEFQVILRDCEDRGILGDMANEIIASLSQPYSVEGSRCIIGASIGVAVGPLDGRTSEELIRNADLALYASKDGGRGRFRFFSSELLQAAEDKRLLEEDLRDALAKGEIQLSYQPIVNAKTNIVTGVEALIRWEHPERGPISPALFIPIAEEANLIEPLGEWVLRKACEDAAKWPGKLRVAVNVSPIQFMNESLPKIVMSALAASGLAADQLELEITEGVFLSENAETDTMFTTLKEIGVRLALDDFGTGYSSLGYLRTAPFDKIKIDQSFVRAATLPGSRNAAIIAAIVALAVALEMDTTAEGIESLDQLQLVQTLGVSHIQGYVYSKAVSSDELSQRLVTGDWIIAPSGPARQRSDRQAMYRRVGAIYGKYYQSILIRNLSESGALIEGLGDVPPGTPLLIDFGEGQLTFARVRRASKRQHGIEFDQPLVRDGDGGFCTSHRVSPYLMAKVGLPPSSYPDTAQAWDLANASTLEQITEQLGLSLGPARPAATNQTGAVGERDDHAPATNATGGPNLVELKQSGSAGQDGMAGIHPSGGCENDPTIPTIQQLSVRYLDQIRADKRRHDIDDRYLRKHILPSFGQLRFDEFAQSDVAGWLTAKSRVEGYPPATAGDLHAILNQICMLGMQWAPPGAGINALQGLSMFNARVERERCLTHTEADRLISATLESPNSQLKFIVFLLMLTGVRQRDLLEAHWDHIDLEHKIWHVPIPRTGKVRDVHLSSAAIDVIRGLPRWDKCPHLIANPKTKKPYRSFFQSWDTARTKAGLPDIEIDDLPHCGVRDIISAGRLLDFTGKLLEDARLGTSNDVSASS